MCFKSAITGAAVTAVALGAFGASIAHAGPIAVSGSIGLSVPEPASLTLLGAGLLGLGAFRRRKG